MGVFPVPMPRAHEDIIADCLSRLDAPEAITRFELLRDDDGVLVYHLTLPARSAMLKWTQPSASAQAKDYARREIHFHQTLAPQVPLSIPRMLGSYGGDDFGLCALWTAHEPAKHVMFWRDDDYFEATEQLAQMHAAYWNRVDRLTELRWLRRNTPEALDMRIREAYAQWRKLKGREHFASVLTDQAFALIRELLLNFAEIEKAMRALPATLVVGDCRASNLMRGASGNLVWWGWGDVGIGRGPEDLASLFEHAQRNGAIVRSQHLLKHYHTQIKIVLGDVAAMVPVQRVLDAAEMRAKLLRTPFALERSSVQDVADVVHRIDALARKLDVG